MSASKREPEDMSVLGISNLRWPLLRLFCDQAPLAGAARENGPSPFREPETRPAVKQRDAQPSVTLRLLSFLARASSTAFRTLGGDIGSSVKRRPVAFSTALAMAA